MLASRPAAAVYIRSSIGDHCYTTAVNIVPDTAFNHTPASIMSFNLSWQLIAASLLFFLSIKYVTGRRAKLPPGPSRLPLLGSLHKLPPSSVQKKFLEWGQEYG